MKMRAEEKLYECGPIENLMVDGNFIQLLPTRTLPLGHLLEKNWAKCLNCGHFRNVRNALSLKDGRRIGIYVKSPERVFTADKEKLTGGGFWWGGNRSGEMAIDLSGEPLVEEVAVWEAIFLLELDRQGIAAEKPQAIVTSPNGEKELLIAEVEARWFTNCLNPKGLIATAIRQIGFLVNDLQALTDDSGNCSIIDVNRWQWPPFTDASHAELLELVRNRAK